MIRNRGERRVACERGRDRGVVEWEKRKVPPDTMRGWISPNDIFESAGRDLIIVGGITPATEAGNGIIVEDIGIEQVLRV